MKSASVTSRTARKRATNVSIDVDLLNAARALKVNVSKAAERGIAQAINDEHAKQWLFDNQSALESSNTFIETHGLPLAKYRLF